MATTRIIPEQETGASSDIKESAELKNEKEAIMRYHEAKKRLLSVYEWHKYCDLPSSQFVLTDQNGTPVHRFARRGDYFKIDIPAPGNAAGDGYDWVQIEEVMEQELPGDMLTAVRVRPCPNPFGDQGTTAHFFEDKATSTFLVHLNTLILTAEVHGRNELANVDTGSTLNNIRNVLIAWGAKFGLSFPQWKSLVKGLLK